MAKTRNTLKNTLCGIALLACIPLGIEIGNQLNTHYPFMNTKIGKYIAAHTFFTTKKRIVETSHLAINPDDTVAQLTYKSFEEGLEDIKSFVGNTPDEEEWTYYSDIEKDGKRGVWLEIGVKSKFLIDENGRQYLGVTVDTGFDQRFRNKHPEAKSSISVHNHPPKTTPAQIASAKIITSEEYDKLAECNISSVKTTHVLWDIFTSYSLAEPSPTDINSMIRQANGYKRDSHEASYMIVSTEGETTFRLTKEGVAYFTSGRHKFNDSLLEKAVVTKHKDGSFQVDTDYIIIQFDPDPL